MSETLGKQEYWHNYYQQAWQSRQKLMESIIDSGERNPLRVINKLSSILRFSDQGKAESTFICQQDSKYIKEDIRNVTITNGGSSINIQPEMKFPGGRSVDALVPHRGSANLVSSYSDSDKVSFIADYCRSRKFDAVIELGSGYSQNLIKLFYLGGPNVPYFGGEYTDSGTRCAEMLSDLAVDFKLIPFKFDFCHPEFSSIPKFDNALVFTSHAIEQVNVIPAELMPKIASIATQVTCLHMEPFGFQLSTPGDEGELDSKQREIFDKNSWNQNLLSQLVFHGCNNNIDLQYIGKNILGGDYHNPCSLALWKSIDKKLIAID